MSKTARKETAQSEPLESILLNPKAYFDDPFDVVTTPDYTHSESLQILDAWREDAEALQRAEAENMMGGEEPQLHRVIEALNALTEQADTMRPTPTVLATPLAAPTALSPGLVESVAASSAPPAQPRSRKQLLGPDRRVIFRFVVGLLVLSGLFFMLFGPVFGDDGRISYIGLGVIILEAIVLGVGLLWLLLVKMSKPRRSK